MPRSRRSFPKLVRRPAPERQAASRAVRVVGDDAQAEAKAKLGGSVNLWNIPTDDLWCRDSGPTFVKNAGGELAVSQIQFNGWGNKQQHGHDAQIARRVAELLATPYLETGLVGEQGGLEHDGAGLVLAHASSWVNPNPNTGSEAEIGALGFWLP